MGLFLKEVLKSHLRQQSYSYTGFSSSHRMNSPSNGDELIDKVLNSAPSRLAVRIAACAGVAGRSVRKAIDALAPGCEVIHAERAILMLLFD